MTQRRKWDGDVPAFQRDDADCVFCQIVARQRTASIVYDEPAVLAFLDSHPLTPGHLLVIPKGHVGSLSDLDEPTGARIFTVATRLSAVLRRDGVDSEAINLFLSDGAVAGQEVFHVHLHVIPRFTGDPFGEGRPLKATAISAPTRGSLDEIANRLQSTYAELFPWATRSVT